MLLLILGNFKMESVGENVIPILEKNISNIGFRIYLVNNCDKDCLFRYMDPYHLTADCDSRAQKAKGSNSNFYTSITSKITQVRKSLATGSLLTLHTPQNLIPQLLPIVKILSLGDSPSCCPAGSCRPLTPS